MDKIAFSSFCSEYVRVKEASGRLPATEKTADLSALPLILGAVQGIGRGRSMAGQTAAAMAPKGRVGRSEELARQAATFGAAAGVIGGLGLLHRYQADKVVGSLANKAFPRGVIGDPGMQQAVISLVAPAVAATLGGMVGGTLTGTVVGGVQKLRGPLYGKKTEKAEGTKEATDQTATPPEDVYKRIKQKYPHLAPKDGSEKKAGVVGRLAKNMGHGPVSNFLIKHEDPIELAGLGVLAAPSIYDLHHAAKQHQMGGPVNKGEVAKGVAETAGLGILAAPVAAKLLKGVPHHG